MDQSTYYILSLERLHCQRDLPSDQFQMEVTKPVALLLYVPSYKAHTELTNIIKERKL